MATGADIGSVLPGLLDLACDAGTLRGRGFRDEDDFWAVLRSRLALRCLRSEVAARCRTALLELSEVDVDPETWSTGGYEEKRINPGAPVPAAVGRIRRVEQAVRARLSEWDERFAERASDAISAETSAPVLLRLMEDLGIASDHLDVLGYLVLLETEAGFPLAGGSLLLGHPDASLGSVGSWLSLTAKQVASLVADDHPLAEAGVWKVLGDGPCLSRRLSLVGQAAWGLRGLA